MQFNCNTICNAIIVLSVQRKFLTMAKKSVKLYTDNVLEAFYTAIVNNTLDKLHIPHSDVFYVRQAVRHTMVVPLL